MLPHQTRACWADAGGQGCTFVFFCYQLIHGTGCSLVLGSLVWFYFLLLKPFMAWPLNIFLICCLHTRLCEAWDPQAGTCWLFWRHVWELKGTEHRLWNDLPEDLRLTSWWSAFKSLFNTNFYQKAFLVSIFYRFRFSPLSILLCSLNFWPGFVLLLIYIGLFPLILLSCSVFISLFLSYFVSLL